MTFKSEFLLPLSPLQTPQKKSESEIKHEKSPRTVETGREWDKPKSPTFVKQKTRQWV